MTTPDTPEPTCERCDGAGALTWAPGHSTPCLDCQAPQPEGITTVSSDLPPTEAPAEDGQSTRIIPARSDRSPTEAPAPAAPSVLDELRDCVIRFTIHMGTCPTKKHLNEPCECGRTAQVDALIAAAARVPGGAGGEALEAAWKTHAAAMLKGRPRSHGAVLRAPRYAIRADFDAGVAVARAPGPVGGELEPLRDALREIMAELHQSEHTPHYTDLGAPTTARVAYNIAASALAAAAPAEPGGG